MTTCRRSSDERHVTPSGRGSLKASSIGHKINGSLGPRLPRFQFPARFYSVRVPGLQAVTFELEG